MAKYSVHFFCDECGQVHRFPKTVKLDDGPADKATIGDVYSGREIPENVATLICNKAQCPNTEVLTLQADNNQVFLVPIE